MVCQPTAQDLTITNLVFLEFPLDQSEISWLLPYDSGTATNPAVSYTRAWQLNETYH